MKNKISGSANLPLPGDPSGNFGYTLTYSYAYEEGHMAETIEFSDIEFSGPGTWEDFSEGDEYPYRQMTNAIKDELVTDQ